MSDRIPNAPPPILPLPHCTERPLFSVMIPTYNCLQYLGQTIESVLAQDPGQELMQIEVVDDCSTDGDVEAFVKSIGKGRVSFFQQPFNKGSLRNFETCINRSKGIYVHLLHGDDMVKQGFYEEIKTLFITYPEIGSAITNFNWIDENEQQSAPTIKLMPEKGILANWLDRIAAQQLVQPPAVVVRRSVYEKLGSFFAVHYGEDWEMWIRIASQYKFAYSPKCLATYRGGHSSNISAGSVTTGENFRDLLTVINISQSYLPQSKRKSLKQKAKQNFSISYTKSAYKLFKKNPANKRFSFSLAHRALKFNINIRSIYWTVSLYLAWFLSVLKKQT